MTEYTTLDLLRIRAANTAYYPGTTFTLGRIVPEEPKPVTPRVGTLLVIADGYLWEAPVGDCPGPLLPGAREKLDAARAGASRVVIASFCANTHVGAQRCRAIIERDLGMPLSASFDLHTANGFPIFDKVVGA